MAVTGKKRKARLDFSSAVEAAVPSIGAEEEEIKVEQPVEVPNVQIEQPTAKEEIGEEDKHRKNQEQEVKEQEDLVPEEQPISHEEPAIQAPQVVEDKQSEPKEDLSHEDGIETEDEEDEEMDAIDAILSNMRVGRGVQKSVYLDEDVYNYIQGKCKKTHAKFSNVLNLLVRAAIKQQHKK